MQASPAKNETRLPRQVLRMSQELTERYTTPSESKTDPAENVPPADPPSSVAATPAENEPNPGADPRENDPAYWKQRFKVTQGVLAAERTDRKAREAEFNRRLTELQEQVAQLQASAPTPTDLGKYFTPEQVEELGEEECNARVAMIEKAVKTQLAAAIEKEVKPLREHRQAQEATDIQDRKAAFLDQLGELVPEYAEIDTSDDFLAWLEQLNDDGIAHGKILNTHVQAFNAPMVAKVFKSFLKTKKPSAQPPVAPHGTGAGGQQPPAQRSLDATPLTPAEIRDFYKRAAVVRKGQPGYVTDQERAQFEARLKL